MKISNLEKSQTRKEQKVQNYAAASSLGFNALGAQIWAYPGIMPKAYAIGLGLKGARDYARAFELGPVIAKEPRQRLRARFNNFMEVWSQQEGTSLKDRLKRGVGTEALDFRDKEFRMRFNRMMGGMAFGLAGIDLIATGTTVAEKMAGAVMLVGGGAEHIYNQLAANGRAHELDRITVPQDLNTPTSTGQSSIYPSNS